MQFPNRPISDAQLPAALRALLRNRTIVSSFNVINQGSPWSKRVIVCRTPTYMEIFRVVRHRTSGQTKWGQWNMSFLYSDGPSLRMIRPIRN